METNTAKENALNDLWSHEEERLQAEAEVRHHVGLARNAGASWADVGKILGITRQAAQQKYGLPLIRNTSRDDQYTPEENAAADVAFRILSESNHDTAPATPSIFLAPEAPAKVKASKKIAPKAPANRISGIIVGPPHVKEWPEEYRR